MGKGGVLTMESGTQLNTHNLLLKSLPSDTFSKLEPDIERLRLRRGDIIYHSGNSIKDFYFPESCIVSSITVFDDGASIESGIVGPEGMTGVNLLLSNTAPPRETCIEASGYCLRIRMEKFRTIFRSSREVQQIVSGFASVYFEQVAQIGACSNHHPLRERLARLLLMWQDRTVGRRIRITQDIISQLLCVHRPSVTLAAAALKDEGLIDYSRGSIVITDRPGLESAACECYEAIVERYRAYVRSLETRVEANKSYRQGRAEVRNEFGINAFDGDGRSGGYLTIPRTYSLCSKCRDQIVGKNGDWQRVGPFSGEHPVHLVLSKDICPSCRESVLEV